MKKLLILITVFILLSGCASEDKKTKKGSPAEKDTKNVKERIMEDSAYNGKKGAKNYQNEELGISFKYPARLGETQENKYKDIELVALKFTDVNGKLIDLEMVAAGYDKLRACDDIMMNGFNSGDQMASDCKTLKANNHEIVVITFKESKSGVPSKSAHFETKKGVWALQTSDEALYEDLKAITKSIRHKNTQNGKNNEQL